MKVDWKLIRNDYEILHSDVKELCASHHVSEKLVRLAIEEGGWKRKDAESMAADDLSDRLKIMETQHQRALVPRFIALQAKMLEKCEQLLDGVEGVDDAKGLQLISDVIEKHRPAIMAEKKDQGGKDTGMTLRILTQAGTDEQPSTAAIEITQRAGESNGLGAVSTGHNIPTIN